MIYILKYTYVLCYHKLCIFLIGLWANWTLRHTPHRVSYSRLIFHDWVKFLPAEFFPYARKFCLPVGAITSEEWQAAYRHHYTRMDHHAEYHFDEIQKCIREMPHEAVVELAVDWLAAEVSYGGRWPGPHWVWLKDLPSSRRYHPSTLALLCAVWDGLGFPGPLTASGGKGLVRRGQGMFWVNAVGAVTVYAIAPLMLLCIMM